MKTILFLLSLPILAFGNQPRSLTEAEHTVIYRNQGQYSAFPRLYQLPDGILHVMFRARVTSSHVEPRADTMRFISKDGGRTWQPTNEDALNPSWATGPTKPGRLVDANAHAWRYVAPERREEFESQGIEVRNSPDGRVTYAYGYYVRISEDNGNTWQQREIPVPRKGLIMSFLGPATDLRLDASTLLCSVYGRPTANIRFYESWLLRSEDDGATWDFLTVAADPRKERSFGETSIEEAANGDIVAMMSTEPALGSKMWTAHSTDRGKTWSKAVETNLPGRPGDNGYPLSVELADGSLVSVYYITRDGVTGIEATRWENPWN